MPGTLAPALLAKGGLTDFDASLFWSTLFLFLLFAVVMSKLPGSRSWP